MGFAIRLHRSEEQAAPPEFGVQGRIQSFLTHPIKADLSTLLGAERSTMEEQATNEQRILTLREVAMILRCSKTHVAHAISGQVRGLPRLTHFRLGRRKLVRRECLEAWMEANKTEC